MLAALLPVFLLLAAAFVFAGVAAGSNEYQIKRDYDVSHLWETRERLVTLLGFSVLAFVHDMLTNQYVVGPLSVVLGFIAAACLFGLRFDVRLNLRRGLARDYIGLDPETAAADEKARALGLSGKQYAALKLAALLVAVGVLLWIRL